MSIEDEIRNICYQFWVGTGSGKIAVQFVFGYNTFLFVAKDFCFLECERLVPHFLHTSRYTLTIKVYVIFRQATPLIADTHEHRLFLKSAP